MLAFLRNEPDPALTADANLKAEREGFEPPVPLTVHLFSKQAH